MDLFTAKQEVVTIESSISQTGASAVFKQGLVDFEESKGDEKDKIKVTQLKDEVNSLTSKIEELRARHSEAKTEETNLTREEITKENKAIEDEENERLNKANKKSDEELTEEKPVLKTDEAKKKPEIPDYLDDSRMVFTGDKVKIAAFTQEQILAQAKMLDSAETPSQTKSDAATMKIGGEKTLTTSNTASKDSAKLEEGNKIKASSSGSGVDT